MDRFDLLLIDSLERIMGERDADRETERERRHFTQASVGLRPQPQVPLPPLFPSQLY